jgi:hypothetical protein
MFKVLIFKLHVFFTKLRKGQYSYEYVSVFKDNDLRSPFSPCIKDDFFSHILTYIKRDPTLKVYKTKENIQFGNTPFTLKYDDIFRSRGIPFCFNALKLKDYRILIIGYHDTIQNSKIKTIYFFANDIFIFGEYAFTNSSVSESISFSEILVNKYISESTKDIDEFFIEDNKENLIYYKDNGFEINIRYYNSGDAVSKTIYSDIGDLMVVTDFNSNEFKSKLNEMF